MEEREWEKGKGTSGQKQFRTSVMGMLADVTIRSRKSRILGYMSSGDNVPDVIITEANRDRMGRMAMDASKQLTTKLIERNKIWCNTRDEALGCTDLRIRMVQRLRGSLQGMLLESWRNWRSVVKPLNLPQLEFPMF